MIPIDQFKQEDKRTMRRIHYTDLPASAWNKISERQKSYIDEFEFYQLESGYIEAHYGGDVFTWDGIGWR